VLFSLLAGVGSAQKALRYTNAPYHFSLDIPAGWVSVPESKKALVAFAGPRVQGFAATLNVTTSLVGDTTLAEYTNATKQRYAKVQASQNAKTQSDRTVRITSLNVFDEKSMTLGELPARCWRVQISSPQRPTIEERQVFCIKEKRGFVVTFSTRILDKKQNDPIFDKLLASFKWDK
jgi:hypothetical protein